jgi:hypothetical protein
MNDLLLSLWAGRKEIAALQRIGHALRGMRGRVFDRYGIRTAGRDSVTKSAAFRLEPITARGFPKTPETPKVIDSPRVIGIETPTKTPLIDGDFGGSYPDKYGGFLRWFIKQNPFKIS